MGPDRPVSQKKVYAHVPHTLDAKYLTTHLGSTLTEALHEISERRPWDPIEYLGQWLHNFAAERARKQADRDEQYMTEVERVEAEREKLRKRRRHKEEEKLMTEEAEKLRVMQEAEEAEAKAREEEQKRLKELEEVQKRQREGADPYAQAPDLATVSEEQEQAEAAKKLAASTDDQAASQESTDEKTE